MNEAILRKLVFKWAGIGFLGLVGYFILMEVLGVAEITELRALNILIAGGITYFGIKELISNKANYLEAFLGGFGINIVMVAFFSIASGIYITFLDPSIVDMFANDGLWGRNLSATNILFLLIIEGSAGGLILTLISLQIQKNSIRKGYVKTAKEIETSPSS